MHANLAARSTGIPWEYVDKKVSPWGGMRLMQELVERCRVREKLRELPLPRPRSNCGYAAEDIIISFWVCVWLGGSRFTDTMLLRYDDVLREIFGWRRVPSISTYTRFFRKFNQQMCDAVFGDLQSWFFQQIQLQKLTLDLDSTVITRYGEQEGARRGYNPTKRGRPSHHPLLAFVADIRMVLNGWLRPGNVGSSNNVRAFMEETLRLIPADKVGLIRADSGFWGEMFFQFLEERGLSYIICARLNAILKNELLKTQTWVTLEGGVQVSEISYQAKSWHKARRLILVRQSVIIKHDAPGVSLFPDLPAARHFRYQVMGTDLTLPPVEVWRLYCHRADAENRIKELKYDFGMKGFCLKDFYGTEAAFRTVLVAYNLFSLFRQGILQLQSQSTLATLRFRCFAIGSWVVKNGRNRVLKLSLAVKRRAWMDGLFGKLIEFQTPILLKT